MGEAVYYLVALFNSREELEKVKPEIVATLNDVAKFKREWQEIRMNSDIPVRERMKMLMEAHPWVAEHFGWLWNKVDESDRYMNFLAGVIEIEPDYSLRFEKNYVILSNLVWHLSNWDDILEFFRSLGAKWGKWWSDEKGEEIIISDILSYFLGNCQ